MMSGKLRSLNFSQFVEDPAIPAHSLGTSSSHVPNMILVGDRVAILPGCLSKGAQKRGDERVQTWPFRDLGRRCRGRVGVAGCTQRDVRATGGIMRYL